MMDHAFVSGLHEALGATKDHEKVLQMDPQYADAEMVVGVEKFCAATLPAWLKPVGRLLGLSGTKADGLRMLHEAAERGTITVVQSQIASTIFLRHDARYTEALAEQQRMAAEYPNLSKDRGDGWKAIGIYRAVIADAGKKGYFVEPRTQLAWFGLGEGLRGQNAFKDAADAYAMVGRQPTCAEWLRKRAEQDASEMALRASTAR
jgi:tetratricopeptide (TPR) repeat protein